MIHCLRQALHRHSRLLTGLFFVAVIALGLLTAGAYGRPWDESDETDILRMNLWEYTRALGLDEGLFEQWAALGGETISALTPISESIEQDHGIAAFYPLAGIMLDLRLTEHTRMMVWHGYCWLLFSLGAFALYACCRQLSLSPAASLLAAVFLLLSPRFFAEGHYNNKDIVLMALCLCVMWQGLRLMKKPTLPRALGFALAGAFAANTKVAGAAVWALCAFFVLLRQLAQKRWDRRVALAGGVTLAAFLALYAALTPALWRDPAAFFDYLVGNALAFGRWENYVRFRGVTFLLADQRLPWYYLPYMIAATTPLWALLLVGLGQLTVGARLCRKGARLTASDEKLGLLLCSLLWLLPLGFAIVTRTTVYNGWRHFYFIYGFMLILAAYGASALYGWLQGRRFLRRCLCLMLTLAVLFTGVGEITQHPYQFAYYQPVVRLLTKADDLELDYWNVSVMDALTAITNRREGELRVSYGDLWAKAGLLRTLPAMPPLSQARLTVVDDPAQADYILENPTYALFSGFEPADSWTLAVELAAYGRPIMRVYENGEVEP